MNQYVVANVSDFEIQIAVFQMNGLGASCPNGLPAYFFQQNWSIVGRDVCHYVREVLQFKFSLVDVNTTFITVILKVTNAKRFDEF